MNDRPKLLRSFSTILPSAEETLLLRAGLSTGADARRAWDEWRSRTGETFIGHKPAIQKLRLLLAQAHERNSFEIDKPSQTFLRMSYFKEILRKEIYRRICGNVLETFNHSGIPFVALKGTALAETTYAPALRHCHDIDLLLAEEDVDRAAALVAPMHFTRSMPQTSLNGRSLRLEHRSRLPLELHTKIFVTAEANGLTKEMRERRRGSLIAGASAEVLSSEDNLLHVCAHAFSSPARGSLRWVSDAWQIITKCHNLDWNLILQAARQSRLTMPLAVMLGYLANGLEATLPTDFLQTLAKAAEDSSFAIPSGLCDD